MILSKNSGRHHKNERKIFVKKCFRSLGKNSFPPTKTVEKSRVKLLAERKVKLAEIADSAVPDALVVFACLVYLRAYFESERRMIYELIKNCVVWQIEKAQIRTEIWLEWIYYRYLRGYTEEKWQMKLDAEFNEFSEELEF